MVRQGHIQHVGTFMVHFWKTEWTFGPSCGKRANSGVASELLFFSIKSISGVQLWLRTDHTQYHVWIFAWNFIKTCLKPPARDSFRKKWRKIKNLTKINARLLLTSSKACDYSSHIFGERASPRSLKTKLAMAPSFRYSWRSVWYYSSTKYVMFELLLHAAFGTDEIWDDIPEPARRIFFNVFHIFDR